MNATLEQTREGQRVRLRDDVERYPHFTAEAGRTGTVVEVSPVDVAVFVRMDEHLPGAEAWDNEIVWTAEDAEAFSREVEVIA